LTLAAVLNPFPTATVVSARPAPLSTRLTPILDSADGKRFLIAAPAASGAAPASIPLRVVMNWTGLLKR
jgi:hypothetical protein